VWRSLGGEVPVSIQMKPGPRDSGDHVSCVSTSSSLVLRTPFLFDAGNNNGEDSSRVTFASSIDPTPPLGGVNSPASSAMIDLKL
jgi:hypothetical protein